MKTNLPEYWSRLSPLVQRVFLAVEQVPQGKVATYKGIALVVGTHPRAIGRILHNNPDPDRFPCHRVLKSDGTIASGFAFGGPGRQQQLLEQEGIVFDATGKTDLKACGYFV